MVNLKLEDISPPNLATDSKVYLTEDYLYYPQQPTTSAIKLSSGNASIEATGTAVNIFAIAFGIGLGLAFANYALSNKG